MKKGIICSDVCICALNTARAATQRIVKFTVCTDFGWALEAETTPGTSIPSKTFGAGVCCFDNQLSPLDGGVHSEQVGAEDAR